MERSLGRAIADAGGNAVVAARLGISEQRLSNWAERGVPVPKCAAVESAVDRRWMRWDMRPTDWREIWPELADMPGAPASVANDTEVREAA